MTTLIVDGYSVAMSPGMSAAGFSVPGADSSNQSGASELPLPGSEPSYEPSIDTSGMPSHLAYAVNSFVSSDGGAAPIRTSYAASSASSGVIPRGSSMPRSRISGEAVGLSKFSSPPPSSSKNVRAGAAQSIQTNTMALNAYRNVFSAQQVLNQSLQRLSTGLRINSAADDAAGLGVAESVKSQVLGTKQAVRNAQDGISLVQTADGVLGTVHSLLQRMRVLAVQGANATNTDANSTSIAGEMDALRQEIGRIGQATEAMGRKILGGRYTEPADALRFQIGAGATEFDTIAITFVDVVDIARAQLGQIPQDAGANAFREAITNIDDQIEVISGARASLGAVQNRFESTIDYLNVSVENLSSAHGRMQDADMAVETMNYMRGRILSQSSNAVLSQALSAPRGVLTLLSAA
ncbi:flagellin [uncultured Mobiluncus sp.]|uniref:flagellin n=1 Tax=uncultured Mobiluncus sp. TaxID=293425 RepID=UPI00260E9226|nr:flagellin [uncultured Mobiluncus sp.]